MTSPSADPSSVSRARPLGRSVLAGLVLCLAATAATGSTALAGVSQSPVPIVGGLYTPLPGTRILDTRIQLGAPGRLTAGGTLTLAVAGQGGVPATGASAVILNVTATGPAQAGNLTLWPAGQAMPLASNLNYVTGQTVNNLVEVGLGPTGAVAIYSSTGADVIADLSGWVGSGTRAAAGRFNPLVPARVVDTRTGLGGNTLGPGQSLSVALPGHGGIPAAGVSAVVMNVTVTDATANSNLTLWPHGAPLPTISALNFTAGQTVANRAVATIGEGGLVDLYNASGSVDVVVDVNGWFTDSTGLSGGAFYALPPARILDTRNGAGRLGPAGGMTVPVRGQGGIPGLASAVVANITVTNTSSQGNLTAWPAGAAMPSTSDQNWAAGQTVPNLAVIALDPNGSINVLNGNGCTDVVIDVVGYYDGPSLSGVTAGPAAVICPPPVPAERLLPVPWNSQYHSLSCESAALQMVLHYRGSGANQNDVMSFVGEDLRPAYYDGSGTLRWGDPYQVFVGNVDGQETTPTGYGMKYPPLAAAATHFGLTVLSAKEGTTAAELYSAILAGHPAVVWGSYDYVPHSLTHYVAFDGRPVAWGRGFEHVYVVVEVSPGGVGILDELKDSSVIYMTTAKFEAQWALFNNAAVIIN